MNIKNIWLFCFTFSFMTLYTRDNGSVYDVRELIVAHEGSSEQELASPSHIMEVVNNNFVQKISELLQSHTVYEEIEKEITSFDLAESPQVRLTTYAALLAMEIFHASDQRVKDLIEEKIHQAEQTFQVY